MLGKKKYSIKSFNKHMPFGCDLHKCFSRCLPLPLGGTRRLEESSFRYFTFPGQLVSGEIVSFEDGPC